MATKPQKIEPLEALARDYVGDGKSPNLFFVTDQGTVVLISRDGETAYEAWRVLANRAPRLECALEDRKTGVLASVEPTEDGGVHLSRYDDYHRFIGGKS